MIDVKRSALTLLLFTLAGSGPVAGGEVYPVAVLPFSERGREVAEQGRQVTDLVFANLAANPELFLVNREDLDTVLKEHAEPFGGRQERRGGAGGAIDGSQDPRDRFGHAGRPLALRDCQDHRHGDQSRSRRLGQGAGERRT